MADINTPKKRNEDHVQSSGSSGRAPSEAYRGFGGPGSEGRGSQQSMQERDLTKTAREQQRGPTTQQLKGGASTPTMKGETNPPMSNAQPNPRRGFDKEVDTEEVRKKAYELYEKRGRQPGKEQDDWYQAEQDLKKRGKTAK